MPDWKKGKIYKIESHKTNKIYIGSTCKDRLCQRMSSHRSDFRKWKQTKKNYISSIEVLKYGDAFITLIESYPCNSKDELRARENYWIKKSKNVTNKLNAIPDPEWQKKYEKKNKVRLFNYRKEYRKKNKDLIKIKKSAKVQCSVCYSVTTSSHFGRHRRSETHKKAVMEDIQQMKGILNEHIAQREQRKDEFEYLVGEFDKN